MTKRVLGLLLAVILLCGVLVGCADEGEAPPAPDAPDPPVGPVTCTLPIRPIDPLGDEAGNVCLSAEVCDSARGEAERLDGFVLAQECNPTLPFSLECAIADDGTVSGLLPAGIDLSSLVPTVFYSAGEVEWNGAPLISGETVMDLSEQTTLTLHAADGSTHTVTVNVQTLYTGLPSVALTTEDYNYISSKTEYVAATLYVGGGDKQACPYAADEPTLHPIKTRGRGNTSWEQPKQSYSVNLESPAPLLDMPAAKKWALVANYEDKSLLRNYVANYLSGQSGLEAVLDVRPVDLWYNGNYWGTYNLSERISVNEARVPMTEQEDVSALSPDEVAFLFEFDGHVVEVNDQRKREWSLVGSGSIYDPVTDEVFFPLDIGGKWLTIKKPGSEELSGELADYARAFIREATDALRAGDWETVDRMIDVTSFVRWYIVEEFMNNTDSSMHSSVFMYRDVGGKLTLGPPWDFDRSSDNCDYWNPGNDPDSLYKSTAGWFKYLFQCPEARAILKTEWSAFNQKLAGIDRQVDKWAGMLSVSQQYNFERWDILGKRVGANPQPVARARTYDEQVEILREYLTGRRGDMDKFIQSLS